MLRTGLVPLALLILLAPTPVGHGHSVTPSQDNQQPLQPHTLPLIVDGSRTPDKIPDDLAYRHFILAIALAQNASSEDISRRLAILHTVPLSPDDTKRITIALTGVREQLDLIDGNAQSSLGITDELRAQRRQVLDDARARIDAALSAEGRIRVAAHMRNHVKTRIRILGM